MAHSTKLNHSIVDTTTQKELVELAHRNKEGNLILKKSKENGLDKGPKGLGFTKTQISDQNNTTQTVNPTKQAANLPSLWEKFDASAAASSNQPDLIHHHLSNTRKVRRKPLGLGNSSAELFWANYRDKIIYLRLSSMAKNTQQRIGENRMSFIVAIVRKLYTFLYLSDTKLGSKKKLDCSNCHAEEFGGENIELQLLMMVGEKSNWVWD